ncbi:MAG: Crp/Fnr family transcriptional regulator [Bdellovibrio sp. CG12_big_fil_rev_8_21_14_0_65_39_13]|nr:MAG: Crp/Fnr family transcriptional regulator [Bdellovibrio sp. CG22_combo_CG10-13_8_21_14_all_39_27]PIQ58078.1 MAG: Crp/Fnr family transcriptional regulator [Bdellovibrio sp. CG12_big_fil_rev_8_21_14_0_65_39_13]PIR32954.1 MAG: Crp/Fnr family transcriptional regulator [Bdellovibrio sp. CG11_big_fil_rev_8_21_14_0_20_39_38]
MQKTNSNKGSLHCKDCPSRENGIFCAMELASLEDISNHKVTNVYKKGQTLFVQGNHPFGIYCVSSGNIKVSKIGSDGKESIVRIVSAGDILGHRSLFTDQFYSATATALEDTKVCFIDKKYIMKTISENPEVSLEIINKLSRDMGAAESRITSMHQKNVRERLAELFLLLKDTHGQKLDDGRWKLDLKLTREEMATMIGTANETLIRFISEFKDAGLIEQEGKTIFITNEAELLEWANVNY